MKGLDINSKIPPSQYDMFKLVTNRRFMRAVKRVMEELKAAGLKMNSDVCSLAWVTHSVNTDVVVTPFPPFSLRTRCKRS